MDGRKGLIGFENNILEFDMRYHMATLISVIVMHDSDMDIDTSSSSSLIIRHP
jgi:hypothetical protein